MKIGESCCEKRNFVPKTMEVNEQGCVLSEAFDSWYYLPFDEPQNTSDWWEMDKTKRKKLLPERLNTRLEIRELPEGLELHLKADGLKGLPLRLEICIPAGTTVENEHFYMKAEAGSGMILRDGCLQVKDSDRELVMCRDLEAMSSKDIIPGKRSMTPDLRCTAMSIHHWRKYLKFV